MPQKRYGSATAQDLYRLFIRRDVLDIYPYWELIDDDDSQDPVPDDWYVVVDIGNPEYGIERRRLDAARLWMAIITIDSQKTKPLPPLRTSQKCSQIVHGMEISRIKIEPADADTVMQMALFGQVVY